MTIGEKIKSLRKKNDITQEKLADYLGISYQSISKWENNSAMPDISLVVPLANFFGVSTDVLFDLENRESEAEIESFEKQFWLLHNQGRVREMYKLCRDITMKYPRNYSCLGILAHILLDITSTGEFSYEEQASALKEGLELCERIMTDCTDDKIRAEIRQYLTMFYDRRGDGEKALEIASQAPSMYYSSEMLSALSFNKKLPAVQHRYCDNILEYTNLLTIALWSKGYADTDDAIKAYKAGIAIWNTVIYDGNFLYYHYSMLYLNRSLAELYAQNVDREQTLFYLNEAKYHAVQADKKPCGAVSYTCAFINKSVYNPDTTVKNYTGTETELFKKRLADKCYDFIRNDVKFVELLDKL